MDVIFMGLVAAGLHILIDIGLIVVYMARRRKIKEDRSYGDTDEKDA